MSNNQQYLTVSKAAAILNVRPSYIYTLLKNKELTPQSQPDDPKHLYLDYDEIYRLTLQYQLDRINHREVVTRTKLGTMLNCNINTIRNYERSHYIEPIFTLRNEKYYLLSDIEKLIKDKTLDRNYVKQTDEAAVYLNISISKLRDLRRMKLLVGYRSPFDNRMYYLKSDLDCYAADQMLTDPPKNAYTQLEFLTKCHVESIDDLNLPILHGIIHYTLHHGQRYFTLDSVAAYQNYVNQRK